MDPTEDDDDDDDDDDDPDDDNDDHYCMNSIPYKACKHKEHKEQS